MLKMFHLVRDLYATPDETEFKKIFERIAKYEDMSDRMENEIGRYLGQVGEAHLSDETKEKIRSMLRQIGELESIGDSFYNLARILVRKRGNKVEFSEVQESNIIRMFDLVNAAMSRMNVMLSSQKGTFDVALSEDYETRINELRATLKTQNITDVDNHVYDYDNGTVFMDIVNEYEKVGDYVVNVAEARTGMAYVKEG